jgi:hypothetical protein
MIAARESGILSAVTLLMPSLGMDSFEICNTYGPRPSAAELTPPPRKAWDCEEIIISDLARSADFTTPEDTLWQLKDCECWKRVR